MNILIASMDDIDTYKNDLNGHLKLVFGDSACIDINDEFLCAAIVKHESKIIGCGFGYHRKMLQGENDFHAGIIGGVAVAPDYQGQGLCRKIIQKLDEYMMSSGVLYSFLFAYQPEVYLSSGYINLTVPIHYYDKQHQEWLQFIYRGSMVKSYNKAQLIENKVVEFQGCVY